MTFRDDREALRQRADGLERDLKAAEAELDAHRDRAERAKTLEAELAEAREMLSRIEAQLKPVRPATTTRTRALALIGGALFVMLLSAAVVVGVLVRRAPESVAVQAPAPAPVVPPMPAPVVRRANRGPEVAQPVSVVNARWPGKVKSATGLPLATGASCAVEAVLRSDQRHEVTLTCGDRVLYRSTDELSGMSQSSTGAAERPGDQPGTAQAAIIWDDIGSRTGPRTQASIRSENGSAAAWQETSPPFRVEVEIPELSEPYPGAFEPGHDEASLPFTERLARKAKVVRTEGPAPVASGTACEVSLLPQWDAHMNCRARVQCAGKTLYGAGNTGFSQCDVADGKPTAFDDDEHGGDPVMHWDIGAKKVELVVKDSSSEWKVQIEVGEK